MKTIGVSREILECAAKEIGVAITVAPLNKKGTRHLVRLFPVVPNAAWQIDTSRKRKCPICRNWTKIIDIPKQVASFVWLPYHGELMGECGCVAMPAEWAHYRRWSDERGDSSYQRISASSFNYGRRVHAVCWHGFRDYFRAVFVQASNAVFQTALDTWRGNEDFEERYRGSGYKNIGSQMYPVYAAEACRCPDSGIFE